MGAIVGYSRAVRAGSVVYVSGTTATNVDGDIIGIDDAYVQSEQVIMNIKSALSQLGSSLDNVVRTRIYVRDIDDWQKIGAAHARYFEKARPATSMIEVRRFIHPDILVEMEAEAICDR